MKRLFKKSGLPEDYLTKGLKEAIAAEQIACDFYRYISEKIKNGRIRYQFRHFADDEVKTHKELLQRRLKQIIGYDYNPDPAEFTMPADPQEFSLIGALEMAEETKIKIVEFYKKAENNDKLEFRKMYEDMIKAQKKHRKAIKRERKFVQAQEYHRDLNGIGLLLLAIQTFK